ncbi:GNAT family N-acetyltransferase [Nocardioides lianchengensis]|uniref:Protein N-acetyltransferase, RimJ/RimL family n=1 Tax=Nocardioides lianchengensis TaxID=1045774 RepID=A0A1G6NMN2_9ACTN|nr:GNAT family N-acetyltransferase [Nocardioides lianchengensis]NYG10830.1 RimJ/RimL family protein N-acetyltransferase [Nocardioides lianchengensis]SDC69252.1 Protein N-acetyltransferase, RimJ/RimL family [Nocardioides lianchengensis]
MHLETDRLLIRPWTHDDADVERLLDIQSRLEVVKWLGDGEPVLMQELDEAHAKVDRYTERSASPPYGFWAVEVRATGVVAGSVILLPLPNNENGEVEIGWHLHPDSWGHGYASEAARAVLGHGFTAGLPEILAVSHTDNYPSQAVMRRIGMTDRGVVEQWYEGPSALFGITAAEWRA